MLLFDKAQDTCAAKQGHLSLLRPVSNEQRLFAQLRLWGVEPHDVAACSEDDRDNGAFLRAAHFRCYPHHRDLPFRIMLVAQLRSSIFRLGFERTNAFDGSPKNQLRNAKSSANRGIAACLQSRLECLLYILCLRTRYRKLAYIGNRDRFS